MKRLRRLCEIVRSISPMADVRFMGVPDRDDIWIVRVAIRDAILVETAAGPLDNVMEESIRKLRALSQRFLTAVSQTTAEVAPTPGESTIPPPPDTPRVPMTPRPSNKPDPRSDP